jgi:polyisoprenyl-phosphate glycosyltransferase
MKLSKPLENVFLSVILVSSDKSIITAEALEKLHILLSHRITDFEIIVIFNQSVSQFHDPIFDLLRSLSYIRIIKLAYPVDNEVALAAGIENCIGDFVVLMNINRDPISVVFPLLSICKSNADVVIGTAKLRQSLTLSILDPILIKIIDQVGYRIPRNATSLRCLSRRAVIAVTRGGRFHHSLLTRMTKIGYNIEEYPYQTVSNFTKQTLRSRTKEIAKLLIFNSTKPMRWTSIYGFLFCFVLGIAGMLVNFDSSGFIFSFFSLVLATILLLLGIQGEYIGRLLNEKSEDFFYMIVEEKNSSVVPNNTMPNVTPNLDVDET